METEKYKSMEWAFDRRKGAFEQVAQDEARKLSIVQEIMIRSTDYLRPIIAPAGGHVVVTMSYLCPHCNTVWCASGRKGRNNWWCAICGEKYDRKQPNRLLVVQTGASVTQAKVFKAHAVPQGLRRKLINALRLLANQQEDGDGFIQNIVTNLCEVSRKGAHPRVERIHKD